MIGGFGTAGIPNELIDGLIAQGAKDLTVVNNNAGNGDTGLAALLPGGPRAQDHLQLSAPGRQPGVRRPVPQLASWNWNWCRKATCPSASARPAPASAPSSRPPATAPNWPKATGDARDQRQALCAGVPHPRRRGADQGRARRPLGQPDLPQGRAQLRPGDGDGLPAHDRHACTRSWSSARWTRRPSSRRASSSAGSCRSTALPLRRAASRRQHEHETTNDAPKTSSPRAWPRTSPKAPS